MNDCVHKLVENLEVSATTGDSIDIWRQLGAMSLAVIGSTGAPMDT